MKDAIRVILDHIIVDLCSLGTTFRASFYINCFGHTILLFHAPKITW